MKISGKAFSFPDRDVHVEEFPAILNDLNGVSVRPIGRVGMHVKLLPLAKTAGVPSFDEADVWQDAGRGILAVGMTKDHVSCGSAHGIGGGILAFP